MYPTRHLIGDVHEMVAQCSDEELLRIVENLADIERLAALRLVLPQRLLLAIEKIRLSRREDGEYHPGPSDLAAGLLAADPASLEGGQ